MIGKSWLVLFGICWLLTACGDRTEPGPEGASPAPSQANNPPAPTASSPSATSSNTSTALKPGNYGQSLVVNGLTRNYLVHLPPAITTQKPLPVVFVLHGGGGNAQYAEKMSKMTPKADREGFIAVYPEGTGNQADGLLTWNVGFCCAYAMTHKIDDVGFMRTLIEKIEKSYPVDAKRIYVTGMSNGAMLTYRLGTELSDQIAAIAPVSGAMDGNEPTPKQPVAVMAFHGLEDPAVPYEGGPSQRPAIISAMKGAYKPVSYAISFWVKNDNTATVPQKEESGNIIKETYKGGKNGTEVMLYTIKNGGHSWPGGFKWSGAATGDEPTQEISATDLMWEFFKQHPKN